MKILIVAREKQRGYRCPIAPFVQEQGNALQRAGCEVEYFIIHPRYGLLDYILAVRNLKRHIKVYRPDIIHAHYGLSGITARLQHHIPVVVTFHNGETHNCVVNFVSSLFSLFANHTIYVAQHIRKLLYFKSKRYSILPCGVNLEELPIVSYAEARKQLGWKNNKKYILFGGAFDNTRKNVALLRDAVALLNRNDIEILEMKGLSRAECALRMCACDVFALPTLNEGSPQTIKEAMACNCPIIATDCADIAHLLGDIPGHYLLRNPSSTKEYWCKDENSVAEMAELIQLSLDFNQRTDGRNRIATLQLDNNQIAERLIEIYTKIRNK